MELFIFLSQARKKLCRSLYLTHCSAAISRLLHDAARTISPRTHCTPLSTLAINFMLLQIFNAGVTEVKLPAIWHLRRLMPRRISNSPTGSPHRLSKHADLQKVFNFHCIFSTSHWVHASCLVDGRRKLISISLRSTHASYLSCENARTYALTHKALSSSQLLIFHAK